MDRFDVIVIGMGPGGEAAAGRLLDAGRSHEIEPVGMETWRRVLGTE